MGLSEYHRKRDFSKTPEPKGEVVEEQRKSPPLRFVVQKARCAAPALRFSLGDKRRAQELGDTEGAEPRPG